MFAYCLARAVVQGGIKAFEGILGDIVGLVQSMGPGQGRPTTALELALGAATLAKGSVSWKELSSWVKALGNHQGADGGWPLEALSTTPPGYYYGSPAITAALMIETLVR